MIIEAPELGKLTFLVGTGDVYFSTGSNPVTGVSDTFLITQAEPGATGDADVIGRSGELPALGLKPGTRQTKPADVALRFTSRESLESFVLVAAELLGQARADVETGDSLEVADCRPPWPVCDEHPGHLPQAGASPRLFFADRKD